MRPRERRERPADRIRPGIDDIPEGPVYEERAVLLVEVVETALKSRDLRSPIGNARFRRERAIARVAALLREFDVPEEEVS